MGSGMQVSLWPENGPKLVSFVISCVHCDGTPLDTFIDLSTRGMCHLKFEILFANKTLTWSSEFSYYLSDRTTNINNCTLSRLYLINAFCCLVERLTSKSFIKNIPSQLDSFSHRTFLHTLGSPNVCVCVCASKN